VARLDVERLEKLQPGDAARDTLPLVSRIELEKARLALKDADSRQKAAAARERSLRSELRALDIALDFHKLRAPIAGYLSAIQVAPGQSLAVSTPVAEVIDLDEIDVVCPVPRHTAEHLAVGQPARLVTNEKPEKEESPRDGKVVYIAVQAQPETGNFVVKVRFPNKDLRLRANSVVRVEVQTAPEKKRLTIPEVALLEDQDPPAVVVVVEKEKEDDKGKKEMVTVALKLEATVGVRDRAHGRVEILKLVPPEEKEGHEPEPPEKKEGAEKKDFSIEGTKFIVEGGQGLKTDDQVKVEEPEHKEGHE
jgi:RND family efflux transporter MFP subunit